MPRDPPTPTAPPRPRPPPTTAPRAGPGLAHALLDQRVPLAAALTAAEPAGALVAALRAHVNAPGGHLDNRKRAAGRASPPETMQLREGSRPGRAPCRR